MTDFIVGLDLSLTSTGVCVLPLDDVDTDTPKVLTINTKQRGVPRLRRIRSLLVESIPSPDKTRAIFIEGYSMGSRSGKAFDIGELGGVVKVFLKDVGFVDPVLIPPTSLKKFITGKGNGKKELMREWVYRKFGLGSEIFPSNDMVDAYSLCRFGAVWLDWKEGKLPNLNKQTTEVLKKI